MPTGRLIPQRAQSPFEAMASDMRELDRRQRLLKQRQLAPTVPAYLVEPPLAVDGQVAIFPFTGTLATHSVLYKVNSDLDTGDRERLVLDLSNAGPIRWLAMRADKIVNASATSLNSTAPYKSNPFAGSMTGPGGAGGGTAAGPGGLLGTGWTGCYVFVVVTDTPGDTVAFTHPFTASGGDFVLDSEYGHVAYFVHDFGGGTTSDSIAYTCTGNAVSVATELFTSGTVSVGAALGSVEASNANVVRLQLTGSATAGDLIAVSWVQFDEQIANDTDLTRFPRAITDGRNTSPLNQLFGWVSNSVSIEVASAKPRYFRAGAWRDFPV